MVQFGTMIPSFLIKIVRGNGQAYSSRTPKKVRADLKKIVLTSKTVLLYSGISSVCLLSSVLD